MPPPQPPRTPQRPLAAADAIGAEFQRGLAAHQAGRLEEAEAAYRRVLVRDPDHFDSLHMLGVIALQLGVPLASLELVKRALDRNPASAEAHNNLGNALRELGRAADAVASYGRALELRPRFLDALHNRSLALAALGRLDEALADLDRALALAARDAALHVQRCALLEALGRPAEARAALERALALADAPAAVHHGIGAALQGIGRLEPALAAYDRALALDQGLAASHLNRGNALLALRRPAEALAAYDRALALTPGDADAQYNRGAALRDLGRLEEALAAYDRALALRPSFTVAWNNRGNALQELGRVADALASFERALELDPGSVAAYNNRGNALAALQRHREALECYDRALAIAPDAADAHNNRGATLQALGRLDDALAAYTRAAELAPDYALAHFNRGGIFQEQRRLEQALACYDRVLELDPGREFLFGSWLFIRSSLCDWRERDAAIAQLRERVARRERVAMPGAVLALVEEPALQRTAAEVWAEVHHPERHELPALVGPAPAERIRIGYFSAEFHTHATTYLMAELFELHDRRRYEVNAFSFGRVRDAMTERIAANCDRFLDVRDATDREVAEQARALGIDVAIDLKGITQFHRAGIFAHRAAPVQAGYLGYPCTMGAPYMDYLIADGVLVPPELRQHYTERIVALPRCYQINDRTRAIAPTTPARSALGLPERGFVFCCFNNSYKITPQTFDVWMRVLQQVEGSVLWLLEDSATAARNLRAEAERRGVGGERLVFAPRLPLAEHLARHRAADLFLDTNPCNAHTTASDALWAGLPLLTRIGQAFAGRVAASLVRAAGLPELVVEDEAGYEAMAVALARDPARLGMLRERLIAGRDALPLFDAEGCTRALESAYAAMHARRVSGLAPDHIVL